MPSPELAAGMATWLAGMAVAGLPLSSRFGGAGDSEPAALLPHGLRGARRGRPPRLLAAPAGVRLARGDSGGSHSPSPVPSPCLGGSGGVGPVRWIQSWAAGSGVHAAGFGAPAPGSGTLSKGWRGRCLAKAEAAATAKGVGTGALLPVLTPLGRGRRPRGWGTCSVGSTNVGPRNKAPCHPSLPSPLSCRSTVTPSEEPQCAGCTQQPHSCVARHPSGRATRLCGCCVQPAH